MTLRLAGGPPIPLGRRTHPKYIADLEVRNEVSQLVSKIDFEGGLRSLPARKGSRSSEQARRGKENSTPPPSLPAPPAPRSLGIVDDDVELSSDRIIK